MVAKSDIWLNIEKLSAKVQTVQMAKDEKDEEKEEMNYIFQLLLVCAV